MLVRRERVVALVGDIDPEVLDRVLASDATVAEIAQAVADIEEELGFDDHRLARIPRVAFVRSLLEPVFEGRDNILRGRD